MDWFFGILLLLFIFVSIAMVLVILVQRPQGGGLSQAFGGGAGGTESVFGGRTGDALTVTTVSCFVVWLVLAMGLNAMSNTRRTAAEEPKLPEADVAPATDTPATLTPIPAPTLTPIPAPTLTPVPAPTEASRG